MCRGCQGRQGRTLIKDIVSQTKDPKKAFDSASAVNCCRLVFTPGVTAAQLKLQPDFVFLASVWKKISTVLVLVTMTGGWK